MTIDDAAKSMYSTLRAIYPEEESHAIVRIVMKHLLGLSHAGMILSASDDLPQRYEAQIYDILHQLKQHRPVQYVLGETEFYGLRFRVNEDVLIPRPETEELVDLIIREHKPGEGLRILDIGTGSGCIPVSLAKAMPEARVSALDISGSALVVARENALLNGVNVEFFAADILKNNFLLPDSFDIIVSNPPYVTLGEKAHMQANVLEHEPHVALFAPSTDSFVFYRAIAAFAAKHLLPEGWLYFEINESYPEETAGVIREHGFKTRVYSDINDKPRMIKAWRHG